METENPRILTVIDDVLTIPGDLVRNVLYEGNFPEEDARVSIFQTRDGFSVWFETENMGVKRNLPATDWGDVNISLPLLSELVPEETEKFPLVWFCEIGDRGGLFLTPRGWVGGKSVLDMDQTERWRWLEEHPFFVLPYGDIPDFWHSLPEALSVHFTKVDPETERVEKEEERNTKGECWLEFGPLYYPEEGEPDFDPQGHHQPRTSYDPHLSCGGPTFEDAFRELCLGVLRQYGDYEREE